MNCNKYFEIKWLKCRRKPLLSFAINLKLSTPLSSSLICQRRCNSTQLTALITHSRKRESLTISHRFLRPSSTRCTTPPGTVQQAVDSAPTLLTNRKTSFSSIGARLASYFGKQSLENKRKTMKVSYTNIHKHQVQGSVSE